MDIQQRFYREDSLLITTLTGDLDATALRKIIKQINLSYGDIPNLKDISDCRQLTFDSSLSVHGVITGAGQESSKAGSKFVIIIAPHNPLMAELAKAYEEVARSKRAAIKIVTTPEEAAQWLEDSDLTAAQIEEHIQSLEQPKGTDNE